MLVKLKNIITGYNPKKFGYDWDTLRKSINDFGYDTVKFEPISIIQLYKGNYLVLNGNHRIVILKELYNEEHEIKANVNSLKKLFLHFLDIKNIKTMFPVFIFIVYYIFVTTFFIFNYYKNKLVIHLSSKTS
jgi:hypothetical protein